MQYCFTRVSGLGWNLISDIDTSLDVNKYNNNNSQSITWKLMLA